ncbi:MAG: DUF86 domain-containing protein [bacterium]|nr:DUF86 domain-containing protein [bacterium]
MPRDMAYLLDILIHARHARHFTAGMTKADFLSDRKCQFAVIRCIEVMGEAVKRLSQNVRERFPQIPWPQMARMRDLLIHAYDRIVLDEVWTTVQSDLPTLISVLETIVPRE